MAEGHQRLPSGDDSDSDYENENIRPRGLTGLQNLGNTCYLNSALQSLSNCPPLTSYFLDCPQLIQPEKSPMLSKSYLKLITELWHSKRPSYVVPSGVVTGIKAVHPMFRGYSQQDAQEFLRCLMDQLHEELKSPYSDDSDSEDEEDDAEEERRDRGTSDGSNNALKSEEGVERKQSVSAEPVERRRSLDSMSSQSELDYETCDSGLSSERGSNGGHESNGCLTDSMNSDTIGICHSGQVNVASSVTATGDGFLGQSGSADLVRSVSTDSITARHGQTGYQMGGSNLARSASDDGLKRTQPGLVANTKEMKETANLLEREMEAAHNLFTAVGIDDNKKKNAKNKGAPDVSKKKNLPTRPNNDQVEDVLADSNCSSANKPMVMEGGDSQEQGQIGVSRDSGLVSMAETEVDAGSNDGTTAVTLSGDGIQQQRVQQSQRLAGTNAGSTQKPQHQAQSVQRQTSQKSRSRKKNVRYESIISKTFDGKILSSVRCLNCETVSTIKETFQDLSLPIPSKDHLHILHSGMAAAPGGVSPPKGGTCGEVHQGWISWMYSWMKSWFVGPHITLQDCLAAFFSADELKGDNMYSCEKCKKLRNGLKYSRVLELPEILSIHLKRFRHEFYSSKINTYIAFPLEGLDMAPYLQRGCNVDDEATHYNLVAIICHHGTAGGGHYTAYCLNHLNQQWYEFDDQYVTEVDVSQVLSCEAYVLFYRKTNKKMHTIRQKFEEIDSQESSILKFYISKQWMSRFHTYAEPGPITNKDFLCKHGGVPPGKVKLIDDLVIEIHQEAWELLYTSFGGGPVCNHLYACQTCHSELERIRQRQRSEKDHFIMLNDEFQEEDNSEIVYAISMAWFREWETFVKEKTDTPPGPIENNRIIAHRNGQPILRPTSDHGQLSRDMWQFLHQIYGGGPELVIKQSTGASVKTTAASSSPSSATSYGGTATTTSVSSSSNTTANAATPSSTAGSGKMTLAAQARMSSRTVSGGSASGDDGSSATAAGGTRQAKSGDEKVEVV